MAGEISSTDSKVLVDSSSHGAMDLDSIIAICQEATSRGFVRQRRVFIQPNRSVVKERSGLRGHSASVERKMVARSQIDRSELRERAITGILWVDRVDERYSVVTWSCDGDTTFVEVSCDARRAIRPAKSTKSFHFSSERLPETAPFICSIPKTSTLHWSATSNKAFLGQRLSVAWLRRYPPRAREGATCVASTRAGGY